VKEKHRQLPLILVILQSSSSTAGRDDGAD
jgi:hypothetical protein